MRGLGAALLSVCTLHALPAGPAAAQEAPPFDPKIDVQNFEYAIGPKSFFTVEDADVGVAGQLGLDALVTFLTNPFTVYNVDADDMIVGERTAVIKSVLAGELSGSYGVTDKLQVGAALPLIFTMSGDGLDPATARPAMEPLQISGLGDLRVEGKFALLSEGTVRLAAAAGLTLPSSVGSGQSHFLGDDLPAFRGRVALQWSTPDGKVSAGANLGVILRKPREIYATEVGQQWAWGVGAAFRVTDRLSIIGESFGRAGLVSFDLDQSPLEVSGGLRITANRSLQVVAGGGAGILEGLGSPDARMFLSVGYAPDSRDSDGDGLANARDKCPGAAEDADGFDDRDGCPDLDNDGDRRDDREDKCVSEAEDIDGFDDDDGCPELDNDADKLPDLEDRCPNDPEDGAQPSPTDGCPLGKADTDGDTRMDNADACPNEAEDEDGFDDWDGCPDLDQDNDNIGDADDKCPVCTEDKDGFEDGDGCPELDNDRDGVADADDKCKDQAETINGVTDFDGCPDNGGLEMARLDGDVLSVDRGVSLDGGKLSRAGELVVDQLALVMLQHREVTSWLVAVAAPNKADADRLGELIRARLVSRGVAATLEVLAAAGPARLGARVQERAEGDGPGVCPSSAEVKQRPAPGPATP